MNESELDLDRELLESQLDRLDEGAAPTDESRPPDPGTFDEDPEGFGFHLDEPEHAVDPLVDEVEDHDDAVLEAYEALVEAFNDRDLDALLEVVASDGEAPGLLGWDRDNLADAIADLWTRRPTVQLGRATGGEGPGAILWEHDGTSWWRVAAVSVDDVVDGRVGVLEFADDPGLLETLDGPTPEDDPAEGTRWQEWEEGAVDT
ncbi:hypothetical protein FTX61_03885 [Nitriliruptoraceae bacterium ZYF776]|nr:hypothetical protein [Profundirhabdus halotolerans]